MFHDTASPLEQRNTPRRLERGLHSSPCSTPGGPSRMALLIHGNPWVGLRRWRVPRALHPSEGLPPGGAACATPDSKRKIRDRNRSVPFREQLSSRYLEHSLDPRGARARAAAPHGHPGQRDRRYVTGKKRCRCVAEGSICDFFFSGITRAPEVRRKLAKDSKFWACRVCGSSQEPICHE